MIERPLPFDASREGTALHLFLSSTARAAGNQTAWKGTLGYLVGNLDNTVPQDKRRDLGERNFFPELKDFKAAERSG